MDLNSLQTNAGNPLTIKQKLWVKHYIETGNATEAARRAGYQCDNEGSLRVIGHENLTKLNTSELMEEMGLTKINLLKVLAAGLYKPVKYLVKSVVTKNTSEGVTREVEYQETPDYSARFKYLHTALELHGLLGPQAVNSSMVNVSDMKVEFVNYKDVVQEQIKENSD